MLQCLALKEMLVPTPPSVWCIQREHPTLQTSTKRPPWLLWWSLRAWIWTGSLLSSPNNRWWVCIAGTIAHINGLLHKPCHSNSCSNTTITSSYSLPYMRYIFCVVFDRVSGPNCGSGGRWWMIFPWDQRTSGSSTQRLFTRLDKSYRNILWNREMWVLKKHKSIFFIYFPFEFGLYRIRLTVWCTN